MIFLLIILVYSLDRCFFNCFKSKLLTIKTIKNETKHAFYETKRRFSNYFAKAANNPVLQKNSSKGGNVTGTGHNMGLTLPDKQKLCVYHARTRDSGNQRVVFIDKMTIDKDGVLSVNGPTVGN
ncbi:family 43 glycosylhydrolase [Dysgonomonas capnocytophagoides]|uniref:family 43 glycosylhydrolase n=1 Tax=Dysgonomonas capnocytophagoides TaxID=45254 RepID=UPI003342AAA1